MTVNRLRTLKAALMVAGVAFAVGAARPCTLALVSAQASANGRALMWKNRDTSSPNNKLMFFKGPKHDFAALVNSEDLAGDEVWGGQNTAGFAIMNSQADDLGDASKKPSAAEMAGFQESVAAEAYEALRKEFAALVGQGAASR